MNPENLSKDVSELIEESEMIKKEITEGLPELENIGNLFKYEYGFDNQYYENLARYQERVNELIDRIIRILSLMKSGNVNNRNLKGVLYPLSSLAQELNVQLEWFEKILANMDKVLKTKATNLHSRVKNLISDSRARIKNYLVPLIKQYLTKIWQIISGLLIPKEWKISGSAGDFMGLTKVGIEITFGP